MCNLEAPDLDTIYQDHLAEGFIVLDIATGGLGNGESEESLEAFLAQTGVTFPVAWDSGTMQQFDWPPAISPYPRQALIGRDGTVRYVASEFAAGPLEAAVLDALAE